MNNTAITIIDYFTQNIDAGFTKQEARERSGKMLDHFKSDTPEDEYTAITGLLDWMAEH